MDADETATSFIEWVYANPGQPPEEYAVRLSEEMLALQAAEREACANLVENWPGRLGRELVAAIRARKGE